MRKAEFNLEYFRFIRQEINIRIKIHYTILSSKIVAIGAIFAFIWKEFDRGEMRFVSFIVSAMLSFLLDIIILENLGWIQGAGHFIKKFIERDNRGLVKGIIRWENCFARPGGIWACFSPYGYLFGTWSIGFLLYSGSVIWAILLLGGIVFPVRVVGIVILAVLSVCYVYLPGRGGVRIILFVFLLLFLSFGTWYLRQNAFMVFVLIVIVLGGIFCGYTMRLIKSQICNYEFRNACKILFGLKSISSVLFEESKESKETKETKEPKDECKPEKIFID